MATIQDRIKQFLEYEGIRIKRFEHECGLGNATVKSMGIGTRDLTYQKISQRYPSLNIEWLRTGRGSMIIGEDATSTPQVEKVEIMRSVLTPEAEVSPPGKITDLDGRVRAMLDRCERLLEKSEMLLENATNLMQTTANLNAAMQIDRQNVQMLFKEVHEGQLENANRSREWFEKYQKGIVDFETEIRDMLATQNQHAAKRAEENMKKIVKTCGTADIAELKENAKQTYLIMKSMSQGATKTSVTQ